MNWFPLCELELGLLADSADSDFEGLFSWHASAPRAKNRRDKNPTRLSVAIQSPSTVNPTYGRNVSLDVLRSVAILLVLGRHLPHYRLWTRIGWIGVDLFFVLS
jgi:hypothetical protein